MAGASAYQRTRGTRTTLVPLPFHTASDATVSYPLLKANGAIVLESVDLICSQAFEGEDTNTHHINLDTRTTAYATPTEIANKDYTDAVDVAANGVEALFSTETDMADGTFLSIEFEEIGTGGTTGFGSTTAVVSWRPAA